MSSRVAVVLAAVCASPAWAGADQLSGERAYYAAGAGGYLSLVGVGDAGPTGEIEWYPGGAWGRFGVRAAYQGFDYDFNGALLAAGVSYTAGATRPHLHVALHGDIALTVDDPDGTAAGIGGGLQTQLWVWGPLAVGLDSTAHVLYRADDEELTLHLASALTLRLSF